MKYLETSPYNGLVMFRTTPRGHPQCWKAQDKGPAIPTYNYEYSVGEEEREKKLAAYDVW